MIVTAPLTVKSTKSMITMQRVSPELKKIQQKYKGDRLDAQRRDDEALQRAWHQSGRRMPANGDPIPCLHHSLWSHQRTGQYGHARAAGLPAAVGNPKGICHQAICALPGYIGTNTKLYRNLVKSPGKIKAFGMDLGDNVLATTPSVSAIPYAALSSVAIGLQYLQMRQLNSRNPQFAQANPQTQMMQRYMPLSSRSFTSISRQV